MTNEAPLPDDVERCLSEMPNVGGFDCLTLAEKIYISNAIKKTMSARIGTLLKKEGE